MTIKIEQPELFDFLECLRFLDRGYDECLHEINENHLIKPLIIDREMVLVQIWEEEKFLKIEILTGNSASNILLKTSRFVHDWFDLDRDLKPFYSLLNENNTLSFMCKKYRGLRLMGISDLFEALCWCVIGQQINLSFAHRLKRRLVENYGMSLTHNSKSYYFFPAADVIAGLHTNELKELQFSRLKAEYLVGIARLFADESITKEQLSAYSDSDQMRKRLIEIRGVGEWTANYVLMKSMRRVDCITFGDSGLNSAVSTLMGLDRKPNRDEIEEFFKPFSGWESYFNIYLWRSLNNT